MRWSSRRGPARRSCASAERRGFTLIEVLAALVIVAIAAVTVVAGTDEALRSTYRARRHLTAVALADAKLAELTVTPTDSLHRVRTEGRFAPPLDAYRWRSEFARTPDAPAIVQVAVTVEWADGSYELATALYRDPGTLDAVLPRATVGR